METICSADGTRIAYERTGDGPPLVLVHGTSADHSRWTPVLPALAGRFSVFAMDRRGRGESGDGNEPYRLENEFDDVAAVVHAATRGGPVSLLGHSYGAICSLEAAVRTPHLQRLILYEPPITQGMSLTPPALGARLEGQLQAGDREGVVETFLQEGARVPPHELDQLKRLPAWQRRVAAAHTIPRELAASDAYRFEATRFCALAVPTLLLLGGDSPAFYGAAQEALHGALPSSRLTVLAGQRHAAMDTAPELFVQEVLAFLDAA
jgi:pimeloyl-ACP methyl ester carboxylesterase